MKLLVSGHRYHKLIEKNYDINYIKEAIEEAVKNTRILYGFGMGYSGMASGVDLWFCETCYKYNIPYVACIPFEGQENTMSAEDSMLRQKLIDNAAIVKRDTKNSYMVEKADIGLIIWDGNKGGTHNVFQQMVEKKKPFAWINPVAMKIYNIYT